jgi:hypothetical protein
VQEKGNKGTLAKAAFAWSSKQTITFQDDLPIAEVVRIDSIQA